MADIEPTEESIGKGRYFDVTRKPNNTETCIKTLREDVEPEVADMIKRRIQYWNKAFQFLDNLGIASLLPSFMGPIEIIYSNDSFSFISPYVEHTLDKLDKIEVDNEFWTSLAFQIGLTIDALRVYGILNTDLKPENIGFDVDANNHKLFKIIDWGALEPIESINYHIEPNYDGTYFTNLLYIGAQQKSEYEGSTLSFVLISILEFVILKKDNQDASTKSTVNASNTTRKVNVDEYLAKTIAKQNHASACIETFDFLVRDQNLTFSRENQDYIGSTINKLKKQCLEIFRNSQTAYSFDNNTIVLTEGFLYYLETLETYFNAHTIEL